MSETLLTHNHVILRWKRRKWDPSKRLFFPLPVESVSPPFPGAAHSRLEKNMFSVLLYSQETPICCHITKLGAATFFTVLCFNGSWSIIQQNYRLNSWNTTNCRKPWLPGLHDLVQSGKPSSRSLAAPRRRQIMAHFLSFSWSLHYLRDLALCQCRTRAVRPGGPIWDGAQTSLHCIFYQQCTGHQLSHALLWETGLSPRSAHTSAARRRSQANSSW